uniref:Uncharacterized protein n=1 Tax=Talaromyces marneffei PM1 TaxID=1077442 RepID=A0A093VH06_TALMA
MSNITTISKISNLASYVSNPPQFLVLRALSNARFKAIHARRPCSPGIITRKALLARFTS